MPRVRLGMMAGLVVGLVSAAAAQDAAKQSFETRFEKDKPFYQKLTTKVDQQLKVQGAQALGSTPQEYGAYIQSEIQRWGAVIKEAGVKLD